LDATNLSKLDDQPRQPPPHDSGFDQDPTILYTITPAVAGPTVVLIFVTGASEWWRARLSATAESRLFGYADRKVSAKRAQLEIIGQPRPLSTIFDRYAAHKTPQDTIFWSTSPPRKRLRRS